jgi:hypothetical protein
MTTAAVPAERTSCVPVPVRARAACVVGSWNDAAQRPIQVAGNGVRKTPEGTPGVLCSAGRLSRRRPQRVLNLRSTTTFAGRSCSRPGTHLPD